MYMYKNDKVVKRYSVSFKLKILNKLSKGELSKTQFGKLYEVIPSTINEQIKKYDKKTLNGKKQNTQVL